MTSSGQDHRPRLPDLLVVQIDRAGQPGLAEEPLLGVQCLPADLLANRQVHP